MTKSMMPQETDACVWTRENLPLLDHGVLVFEEVALLRSHLLACADCQREASVLAQLWAAKPAPPGDLGPKILTALRTSVPQFKPMERPQVDPAPRPWLATGWRPVALAASLLLAVIAGTAGSRFLASDAGMRDLDALTFVDPDLDGWDEDWFVAGAPVLEALSDETLHLLAMEMDP